MVVVYVRSEYLNPETGEQIRIWKRLPPPLGWRTGVIQNDDSRVVVHDYGPETVKNTLRCHPKRCGRTYPLRNDTLNHMLDQAAQAGRAELWLT